MKLKEWKGGKLGETEYDASRFEGKVLYRLLKEAVDSYRTNQRQGTVKTIGRSDVAGSRKKPWKQKHTGRARAGDRKSPIWRGGGTVFGPKPRNWNYQLPSKERRVALRSAFVGKFADGEVVLADFSPLAAAPSSKTARSLLAGAGAFTREAGQAHKVLVLIAEPNVNVWKSLRNFPKLDVRIAADVCAFDIISSRIVLAEAAALDAVAERVSHTTKQAGAPAQTEAAQ